MHKQLLIAVCLLIIMLLPVQRSTAQSLDVITIGAGDAYWSAFGHTAIRITNAEGQQDMYGFGYFDFSDENFLYNFVRGDMHYFLGVEDAARELNYAAYQQRTIHSQALQLPAAEVERLQTELDTLALPQNRQYAYDYFTNNCTSKVRDLLDQFSDGRLQAHTDYATERSWFDVSFPAPGQGWMNLGIAIGFGQPAYQHRSQWELMSLPLQLQQQLQQAPASVIDVGSTRVLYAPEAVEVTRNDWWPTHYPLVLVSVLLAVALLLPFGWRVAHLWFWLQSVIGLVLLGLWLLTTHSITAYNFNLLLFFPMAFACRRSATGLLLLLVLTLLWCLLALWLGAYYLWPFAAINLLAMARLKSRLRAPGLRLSQ